MTRSIRASLITGTAVATIVIILIAGTAVYRGVRTALFRQLDQNLTDEAHLFASAVRLAPDGIELGFDELDVERFAHDGGPAYLEVWSREGTVLYRSPSLRSGDLSRIDAGVGSEQLSWTSVGGQMRCRTVALVFRPFVDEDDEQSMANPDQPMPALQLVLARSVADIDGMLARLRGLLAVVGVFTAIATGVVLALVIRRSLRPLDVLAGEISSLSGGELSSRIQMASAPREVTPVVDQLNDLLGRLEEAFRRERTFSADIAHELRTPLAGLRSSIEVTLSRGRSSDDYQATLHDLLDIIRRLQAMVERLLYLGRLESGQIDVEKSTVDLGELVRASWTSIEPQAVRRGLDVQWRLEPGVDAVTDPLLVEVAIRNVLENAVAYARDGGYVVVSVEKQDDRSVLRVVNDGSEVPQDDVAALMNRFSRADRSRGATGIHFGLGLAIAERIAAILRCSLAVQSTVGGEFEAVISMENGHRDDDDRTSS